VDYGGKPLKILEKLEEQEVWKKAQVVHGFPRWPGGWVFSTAGVENILLVLWKTWGKMLK
jgi:hypothetical protein